jgi:hypothetical protein
VTIVGIDADDALSSVALCPREVGPKNGDAPDADSEAGESATEPKPQ